MAWGVVGIGSQEGKNLALEYGSFAFHEVTTKDTAQVTKILRDVVMRVHYLQLGLTGKAPKTGLFSRLFQKTMEAQEPRSTSTKQVMRRLKDRLDSSGEEAPASLLSGDELISANGGCRLVLQADGNLVLCKGVNRYWSSNRPSTA